MFWLSDTFSVAVAFICNITFKEDGYTYGISAFGKAQVIHDVDFSLVFEGILYDSIKQENLKATFSQILKNDLSFDDLEGSFSAVLIHHEPSEIIAFKDHFGTKPLYSFLTEKTLVISNEINEIVKHHKPRLNLHTIREYFNFDSNFKAYQISTFFHGVENIPPASRISFQQDFTTKIKPNWIVKKQDFTDKEAILEFKENLTSSIEKQYKSLKNDKIVANLSGGLDSSSINCFLSEFTAINSLYLDTKLATSDERFYANKVSEAINSNHQEINPSDNQLPFFRSIVEILGQPDRQFLPATLLLDMVNCLQLNRCKAIFTGEGGDAITAYGLDYLEQLFEEKKWGKLQKSIDNYTSKWDLSSIFIHWNQWTNTEKSKKYLNKFLFNRLNKSLKNKDFEEFFVQYWLINRHLGFDNLEFFKQAFSILIRKLKTAFSSEKLDFYLLKNGVVSSEKVSRFDTNEMTNELNKLQKTHFEGCFTNLNVAVIEQQTLIYSYFGIDVFHPFLDKKVLEAALAISSETKFSDGWLRGTIRESMKGILPEEVRLRTSKVSFAEFSYHQFLNLWKDAQHEITETHVVWKFLDFDKFHRILKKILNHQIHFSEKTTEISIANRTISFALWLDYLKNTHSYSF